MNKLRKSEAVAVRVLSTFLTDDAEATYTMQVTSDLSFADAQETETSQYVFNALLTTLLTDEILQQAYQDVPQAQQRPKAAFWGLNLSLAGPRPALPRRFPASRACQNGSPRH